MKKKLMIIATFLFMFMFVGKVNAETIQSNACPSDDKALAFNSIEIENNVPSGADSYYQTQIILSKTYTKDSIIAASFTKGTGTERYQVIFDETNFEVVSTSIDGGVQYSVLKLKNDLTAGTYDIAKIVIYHKEGADIKNCWVHPSYCLNESGKTCADSDSTHFYNDFGEVITQSEYGYYCQPHKCESYTYTDSNSKSTTVYYDKYGDIVETKDEMINSCKCRQDETTKKYYDWDTTTDKEKEVDEAYYNYYCTPHYCTPYEYDGKTYYYDAKGIVVDTEEEMIASCKCRHDETTDKYYDLSNKEVTKEEYEKVCLCRTEDGKDGKIYYCKQGEICTKEEYDNKCPDNVQTGSNLPIALVGAGLAIAGIAAIATARHNKLRRI
jgi:hypothetical protein